MNDAVFISDLHLHSLNAQGYTRFLDWVQWALKETRSVYILGDFFHAWAGDDLMGDWEHAVAQTLSQFSEVGIPVFLMPGNRDFLLGSTFSKLARIQYLKDPSCISLVDKKVILAHGDAYCKNDKLHQGFRWLTRSRGFKPLFLRLPKSIRSSCVKTVRKQSQQRQMIQKPDSDISYACLIAEAEQYHADAFIHGHTHHPVQEKLKAKYGHFLYYVLSDWDDKVHFLCYNECNGFYFHLF